MIESKKYKAKKDKYTKVRGGCSQLLVIQCLNCNHPILLYQKDGPGRLLRMYLDKILTIAEIIPLKDIRIKSDMKNLYCSSCNELLATPMIYKSEDRLAYRIRQGKIRTVKNKDGFFPPKIL